MFTHSGVRVFPAESGAPTISDIAISLSRIPRFCGHTLDFYSVGRHSLACAKLAEYNRRLKLHMLLHDAHESVTGDIPRTWKSRTISWMQHELDARIYRSLQLARPSAEDLAIIKAIDDEILYAEGTLIGPPGVKEWFGKTPTDDALAAVAGFITMSPQTVINIYTMWTTELIKECV